MKQNAQMKRIFLSLAIPLLFASFGHSQSLWDQSFDGYISGSDSIGVGSTIIVYLDRSTSLSLNASRIDSKRISIELSGGEGDLFAFLPTGTSSSNESLSAESDAVIDGTIAARVVGIDASGSLLLQGQSSLRGDRRIETIEITGVVDPALVSEGNRINSSSVADLVIVFTTVLESNSSVLTADDLVREVAPDPEVVPILEAPLGAATEGVAATGAGTEVDPAGIGTSDPATNESGFETPNADETLSLTDERRQELLLIYLNRLIDLILSDGE